MHRLDRDIAGRIRPGSRPWPLAVAAALAAFCDSGRLEAGQGAEMQQSRHRRHYQQRQQQQYEDGGKRAVHQLARHDLEPLIDPGLALAGHARLIE